MAFNFKFMTRTEIISMSESKRSGGSFFLHDLVTVDFSKVDIYTGVRIATLVAPLLVVGLITHSHWDLFGFSNG